MAGRTGAVDWRRVAALVAVAGSRSLTAAANRSRISLSGLHYQLDALEKEIGVPLVHRSGQEVRLTVAGQFLAERGARLLADLDEAAEHARRLHGDVGPALRVAAPWPVATCLISEVAGATDDGRTAVEVDLAGRDDGLRLVDGGAVDVLAAADWAGDQVCPTGGRAVETLFDTTYLLAVGRSHPLAGRAGVDVADSGSAAWVVVAQGGVRDYLDRQFHRLGLTPPLLPTGDSMEYMTLIDNGRGVGLAEPITARLVMPRTRLVPVTGLPRYRYFAAYRPGLADDPRLRHLLAALRRLATATVPAPGGAGTV